jgi:hypothetical protein
VPAQAGHVAHGSELVEEDQPGRVEAILPPPPPLACPGDVRAVLLGGTERLFLDVSPIFARTT